MSNWNKYKLTNGQSLVLDIIRGVSAQVVVIGHGLSYFGVFTFLHEPNFPWMQNIAVLIFFLLSGFLITYSTVNKSFKSPQYSFSHYFIDRFSRIYAAFIPALFFILLIDSLSRFLRPEGYLFDSAFNLTTFLGNVFMLQDFPVFKAFKDFELTSFGSARPFWTLAREWWIYICFGYLYLVLFKNKKLSPLQIMCAIILSAVPFLHLILGRGNGLTTYWIFGCIVFLLSSMDFLKFLKTRIKWAFVVILCFVAFVRAYVVMDAYDAIFAFLLAICLWLLLDLSKNYTFSPRWAYLIRYNASFSYTLYLIHYSVLDFIQVHINSSLNPYLLLVLGFIVSNVLSIAIGRLFEVKLTYPIKRFLRSKLIKG